MKIEPRGSLTEPFPCQYCGTYVIPTAKAHVCTVEVVETVRKTFVRLYEAVEGIKTLEQAHVQPDPSKLPQAPGNYLWYILDLPGSMSLGAAHIMEDPEPHRAYLLKKKDELIERGEKPNFHIYEAGGRTLTVYFDNNYNPCDATGFPWPDGWREFDTDWLFGKKK